MLTTAKTPNQSTTQTGATPAQEAFQSRPFAEQPLQPEHDGPDIATQLATAQQFGHHFGNISVFPPTQPVIQREVGDGVAAEVGEAEGQATETGLPGKLKANVENLSGVSLNDVHVHYNSAEPSKLMALAYTQGTDIYVGPGQEEHLPHEAWHVVQQKLGQVKPTKQIDGVPINDDPSLEHEAGLVGAKASRQSVSKYTSSGDNSYHSIGQATLAGTPPHMQLGSTGATPPVQMVKFSEMRWILQTLRNWGLDAGIPNKFLPQLDDQSQLDWWQWLTTIVNRHAPGASSPADLDFDTTLLAMQLKIRRDMKKNTNESVYIKYIHNRTDNMYNNPLISDDENDDTINPVKAQSGLLVNPKEVRQELNQLKMDILLEAIYKELASNETGLNINQKKTVDLIRSLPFVQAYARGNRSDFASISQLADAVFIYLSERKYWSRPELTESFKGMILKGKYISKNDDWILSEEEMKGTGQFYEGTEEYAVIDDMWVQKKDLLIPIEREIKIIVPKGTKVTDMSSDKEVKTEQDEYLFAKYDKNTGKYITRDSSGWRYKVSTSDIIMPGFLEDDKKFEEKKSNDQESESKDNVIKPKSHNRGKTISDFRSVGSFIQDPELYDEVKIPKGTRYLTWGNKWISAKKDMFGRLLNEYKEEDNEDETEIDPDRDFSDYIKDKDDYPMWSPKQEWFNIQKAGTKGRENTIIVRKEDVEVITDLKFMPVEKNLFDPRQTLFDEYPNKPQLSHIKQTNIGDCYFEAAVASIAYLDPGYIKNTLIKEHEHTITVNFFDYKHDEKDDKYTYTPRPVTVSKSVPVDMKTQEKYFSGGADWVAIIQKAYQLGEFWKNSDEKEINDDDQTMDNDYVTGIGGGGFSDKVLRTLLGKKFEYKRENYNKANVEFLKKLLPDNDNDSMKLDYDQIIKDQSSSQKYTDVTIELWQEIKSNIAMRKPTTVATKIDPFEGISNVKAPTGETIYGGLVGQHEYTVLQALKVKGIKQDKYWLKLRNPWGNNTGAYTKKKESTIEGIVDLHKDGLIYLDMDYFLKYFRASIK